MDIERLNPNLEKFRKMDILEMLYKGVRCFFVSCVYVSNDKYKEGISLIAQSENIFKLCTRKFEEIKLPVSIQTKIKKKQKKVCVYWGGRGELWRAKIDFFLV